MPRKRLTQLIPALLPLRRWEKKKVFYGKMRLDKCRYAAELSPTPLPFCVFEAGEVMVNPNTGQDIRYQHNKVHNLTLAAKSLSGVLIRPGETFSFWRLVRDADREEPYLDGLELVNGRIVPAYGGGLCQISGLLHLMFLHSPLTVTERHGHPTEDLPPNPGAVLRGTDATVNEGWLDLRVRNDTGNTFQVEAAPDGPLLRVRLLSLTPVGKSYEVYNPSVSYHRENGRVYEYAEVSRTETDDVTGEKTARHLYTNVSEVRYPLPEGTDIQETQGE